MGKLNVQTKLTSPAHFSSTEAAYVRYLIAEARDKTRPYSGNYEAPWLLSNIAADVWLLRTPNSRFINGKWLGACPVDWRVSLADGSLLTEESNITMLSAARKACFLARHLTVSGITNTTSHIQLISYLLCIVRWLYLHRNRFVPEKNGFALIDQSAVLEFMHLYSEAGMAGALGYFYKISDWFYKNAIGKSCELEGNDLFTLPKDDVAVIRKWLSQQSYYERANYRGSSVEYISRKVISERTGVSKSYLGTPKFSAFLRQFEPEVRSLSEALVIPTQDPGREFFSHKTKSFSEVLNKRTSFLGCLSMLQAWELLFKLRHHDESLFPSAYGLKFSTIRRQATMHAEPHAKTPWMPLKVALDYSKEAITWVLRWGPPLVKLYTSAMKHFAENGWLNEGSDETSKGRKRSRRDAWVLQNLPLELSELGIGQFGTRFHQGVVDPYAVFRNSPGLTDAIEVLLGAILLLTANLKPLRTDELSRLSRNCLIRKKGDGYYLRQAIGKRGTEDVKNEKDRPIPAVVASALSLAIEIGDSLKALANEQDPFSLERAFYFNSTHGATLAPRPADKQTCTIWIDLFCDFVAQPPDEFGRRWYFRTHEGRKSFLITFFWCGKYASLGAASWMAGHSSWEQTLTYITANFPGDELPAFEANYAAEQLWNFEKKDAVELSNVEDLYENVCKRFRVSEISLIPEEQLKGWLETAFRSGQYLIEPIAIGSRHQSAPVNIAFRIGKIE